MKADKVQTMLRLIEERLAEYSIEETLERLSSYPSEGQTIEEFIQSMVTNHEADNLIGKNISDLYEE